MSPNELLESVRLDEALRLIITGEQTPLVSIKVGFGSVRRQHEVFKKRLGLSAAQARKVLFDSIDQEKQIQLWRRMIWAKGSELFLPPILRDGQVL